MDHSIETYVGDHMFQERKNDVHADLRRSKTPTMRASEFETMAYVQKDCALRDDLVTPGVVRWPIIMIVQGNFCGAFQATDIVDLGV